MKRFSVIRGDIPFSNFNLSVIDNCSFFDELIFPDISLANIQDLPCNLLIELLGFF